MSTLRLKKTSLPPAQPNLTLPNSAADSESNSIVHLGVGAFHRAHQAVYTDSASNQFDSWRITGASLRSSAVKEQLAPQDYLYTVVERHNHQQHYRIINSLKHVIVASENHEALITAMAAPVCKIISLTITEKGYCHDPGNGELNANHPDIQHDLANPTVPLSAPGFIVAALAERKRTGRDGVSILSCDNLPANGKLVQRVILAYASQLDSSLAGWIANKVSFPCSMVDRIVPATTEQDRQQLEAELGYRDEAMVVCEPFSQWVIEDNFVAGRPRWEKAGASFVDDVHPFETMKLRLLNGSHSTIAYLGFLAGFVTVSDVMRDKCFVALTRYLMDKGLEPTLEVPGEIKLDEYKQQLLERFSNNALNHQTRQIAMDGSQKLPQRIFSPLIRQLELASSDDGIDVLCLAIAAWIRYTAGIDEQGKRYAVEDPLSAQFERIHSASGQSAEVIIDKFFGLKGVFPENLADNKAILTKLGFYLTALFEDGSRHTVTQFMERHDG